MPGVLEIDDAIVLRVTAFGEADAVVHLLTRGSGRVGVFARGGRRNSRRFPGGLEPFSLLRAEWKERRGSELADLQGTTIERPHLGLRSDLVRLACAGYLVELSRELARDHAPNAALYELLEGSLSLLCERPPNALLLRAFELRALASAGLSPSLVSCPRCGRALAEVPAVSFDASGGGASCRSCVPRAPSLSLRALALMQLVSRLPVAESCAASLEGLPLEEVRIAMRGFVDAHVRRGMKSLEFLHDAGGPT